MTKNSIHPSLQRVLDVSGLEMADIAGLLGISLSTVSRWARQGISQAGANKLGKLLSLDPTWIMAGEHDADESAKSTQKPTQSTKSKKRELIAKEAMLEFAEQENGVLTLREMGGETWVSIEFAEALREMLGKETLHVIGQHMIQAGIASFMERQMRQYHAHVYDEKPKHFS